MADEPVPTPAQAAAAEHREQLDGIVDPGQRVAPEAEPSASSIPSPASAAGSTAAAGGLPPALVERAIRVGLSAEEAKSVPRSFLERYITQEESYEPPTPAPQQPQHKYDPYTGELLQKAAPKLELPELPDGEDGFDPRLIKAWKDQQKLFLDQLAERDKKLEEMGQKLTAQEQTRAQQVNEQGFRTLEGLITKDKDFANVFGEGPAHRHAGTHYIAARQEVAVMMDAIAQARQKSGQHVPDAETLYGMAKAALYPELIGKTAVSRTVERARDTSGRFLHKPSATTRSDSWENMAPGPEKAKASLAALMRNGSLD